MSNAISRFATKAGAKRWLLPLLTTAIAGLAMAATAPLAAPPEPGRPLASFAPILEKVIPAVVTIRVTGETYRPVEFPSGDSAAAGGTAPIASKDVFRAGGSGVIIDAEQGYILTNNHVIENATRIEVGLSDGRRVLARLIGRDIGTDVAVIKVEERNLPAIVIGNSDRIRVGDVIMAVGNPFGLEGTATLGIVSALSRTEVGHEAFEDFMQIDAQINPGNSGGALVNIKGELVGINTAVAGGGERNVGIGFAIPINMAKAVKGELIAHGRMRRGYLGLTVEDLPAAVVSSMAAKGAPYRGAIITKVDAGTLAASAGLAPGAVVVRIDGKPVRGAAEFHTRTVTVPVERSVVLTVYSDGRERDYSLMATEMAMKPEGRTLTADFGGLAGAVVVDILPGNPLFGDIRGAQVIDVPGNVPASAVGLRKGDIIIGVDGANVRSTGDLVRSVDRASMQFRVRLVRDGVPGWLRASR